MTFEQLPDRSYPARAFPVGLLAFLVAATGTYPDYEQLPKRAYPLGSHPALALVRTSDTVIPPVVVPPSGGGGGGGGFDYYIPERTKERPKQKLRPAPPDLVPLITLLSFITWEND